MWPVRPWVMMSACAPREELVPRGRVPDGGGGGLNGRKEMWEQPITTMGGAFDVVCVLGLTALHLGATGVRDGHGVGRTRREQQSGCPGIHPGVTDPCRTKGGRPPWTA